MKVQATINGVDITVDLRRGDDKHNHAAIKQAVEETGKAWKESEIFITNFPEKGRSLIKAAGLTSLGANG